MSLEPANLVVHCSAAMSCARLRYNRPVTYRHCGKSTLVTHKTNQSSLLTVTSSLWGLISSQSFIECHWQFVELNYKLLNTLCRHLWLRIAKQLDMLSWSCSTDLD